MLVFGDLDAVHDMEPVTRKERVCPARSVSHHLAVHLPVATAVQQLQKCFYEQSSMADATRTV
jgi:hypothetical protein